MFQPHDYWTLVAHYENGSYGALRRAWRERRARRCAARDRCGHRGRRCGRDRARVLHPRALALAGARPHRRAALARLDLHRAMYVEGGPEAQFFVRAGGREVERLGAFEGSGSAVAAPPAGKTQVTPGRTLQAAGYGSCASASVSPSQVHSESLEPGPDYGAADPVYPRSSEPGLAGDGRPGLPLAAAPALPPPCPAMRTVAERRSGHPQRGGNVVARAVRATEDGRQRAGCGTAALTLPLCVGSNAPAALRTRRAARSALSDSETCVSSAWRSAVLASVTSR